ncbi:MAG: hypothetical protein AAEJ04_09610 [Planctomycetota bacterium]
MAPETPGQIPPHWQKAADRKALWRQLSAQLHSNSYISDNNKPLINSDSNSSSKSEANLHQQLDQSVRIYPPTAAEIETLGFDLNLILAKIDHFLAGSSERAFLHQWVCHALKFAITISLRTNSPQGALVENSLGLLAIISDDDFASHDTTRRLCLLIKDRISLQLPVPSRRAISELLRELGNVSLTVSDKGPTHTDPAWMDISLLPRRKVQDSSISGQTPWFQPLSISTKKLWKNIAPGDPWSHVENDRLPPLIDAKPWLAIELQGLSLYLDPDGITEAIVDSPRIGTRELKMAISGFSALHQMIRCSIDGIPVHSRKEGL